MENHHNHEAVANRRRTVREQSKRDDAIRWEASVANDYHHLLTASDYHPAELADPVATAQDAEVPEEDNDRTIPVPDGFPDWRQDPRPISTYIRAADSLLARGLPVTEDTLAQARDEVHADEAEDGAPSLPDLPDQDLRIARAQFHAEVGNPEADLPDWDIYRRELEEQGHELHDDGDDTYLVHDTRVDTPGEDIRQATIRAREALNRAARRVRTFRSAEPTRNPDLGPDLSL